MQPLLPGGLELWGQPVGDNPSLPKFTSAQSISKGSSCKSKKICKNHYRRMLLLAPSCPASSSPPASTPALLFTADRERGAGNGVKIKKLTVISFRKPLLEQCNMVEIIALTFCYFFKKQAVGCQLCTLSCSSAWCSLLDFVTVLNLLSNHSKFGLLRCTDQTYWKLIQ